MFGFAGRCLLLGLLLWALYINFWRESLSALPDLTYLLERQAAAVLQTQVEIEGVSGGLVGFSPEFSVQELRIQHPVTNTPFIALENARFHINFWRSLKARMLVFDGIEISTARLIVPKLGPIEQSAQRDILNWRDWAKIVLLQRQLQVERLYFEYDAWSVSLHNGIVARASAGQQGFEGHLVVERLGQFANIDIVGRGPATVFDLDASGTAGEIQLNFLQSGAPRLFGHKAFRELQGQAFVSLASGQIQSLYASASQTQQNSAGTALLARKKPKGWDFVGRTGLAPSSGQFAGQFFEDSSYWFDLDIPLEHLTALSRTPFLPRPSFSLTGDLKASITPKAIHGEVNQLRFASAKGLVLDGLSASFSTTAQRPFKGEIQLQPSLVDFELPDLFREPLNQINIQPSTVQFAQNTQGLQFSAPALSLVQGDLLASAFVDVQMPNFGPPVLDLLMQFQSSSKNAYQQYLPGGLSPGFLGWIDQAVQAGRIRDGRLQFRSELPSPGGLELELAGESLDFTFHDDWPQIKQGSALVFVQPGSVEFEVQAQHKDVEVSGEGSVVDGLLSLDLDAHGAALTGVEYLLASPVGVELEKPLQALTLQGGAFASDINVSLDLARGEASSEAGNAGNVAGNASNVIVQTQIQNGALKVPAARLAFRNINGPLDFTTESGLKSDGFTGLLWGRSVDARFETTDFGALVSFNGPVAAEAISAWLPLPMLEQVVGETKVSGAMRFFKADQAPELELTSNLVGISIGLPGTFGKTALQKRHWHLNARFEDELFFQVEDENRYRASVWLDEGDLSGLNVVIGDTELGQSPSKNSPWIVDVDSLDLQPWQPIVKQWQKGFAGDTASSRKPKVKPAKAPEWAPGRVQFNASALSYGQHDLGAVRLSSQREPGGYRVQLDGDTAKGTGFYPLTQAPIRAQFTSLTLPETLFETSGHEQNQKQIENQKSGQRQVSALKGLIPSAQWPPLVLDIRQLWVRLKDQVKPEFIGRLSVTGEPAVGGYSWQQFYGQLAGIYWRGEGAISDELGSEYDLEFSGGGLTQAFELMTALGLIKDAGSQQGPVAAQSVEGQAQLRWQGAIPKLNSITGHGTFSLNQGLLPDISGASPIRWLSLLSAQRFARRFSLDFQGLQQGLAFDTIDVDFDLVGQGRIEQRFSLISPSLKLRTEGFIDLSTQSLFQDCVAIIPLLDHVVLPAVATGNLPAAATAFVIDKVFGRSIDALTEVRWQVFGPFTDPKVSESNDKD